MVVQEEVVDKLIILVLMAVTPVELIKEQEIHHLLVLHKEILEAMVLLGLEVQLMVEVAVAVLLRQEEIHQVNLQEELEELEQLQVLMDHLLQEQEVEVEQEHLLEVQQELAVVVLVMEMAQVYQQEQLTQVAVEEVEVKVLHHQVKLEVAE